MDAFLVKDKEKERGRRAKRRANIAKSKTAEDAQADLVPRGRSKSEHRALKGRKSPNRKDSGTKRNRPSSSPEKPKAKEARTNWANDLRLPTAVKEWDEARPLDDKGKPMSLNNFAKRTGIPRSTLQKYCNADHSKRPPLGTQCGRPSLLSDLQSELLAQVAVSADRANVGLTPAELQANLQKLNPNISMDQAKNHYRTFMKNHSDVLKPRAVKAQKTTSRRSQCTVAQQYRWRKTMEKAIGILREKNKGVCNVLVDARRNMGEMVLDARKNLAEMQLRALCKKIAIDSVDSYLSSCKTHLKTDLTLLKPHYQRSSEIESEDTWKNKGRDLIDETLAEFGFQTKSINYVIKGGFSELYVSKTPLVYELNVTIEGLKE